MEFFLHIGYNMDFKRHRCEGKINKELRAKRKKKIQKAFWNRLRLHIDDPRDGGAGTSNTGLIDISRNICKSGDKHTVWKNAKFSLTEIFPVKSVLYLVTSILKCCFHVNFCQKCMRVNFPLG